MSRRSFIGGSASFATSALLASYVHGAVTSQPTFPAYPFSLGVASGDPAPDGVVLWTRLAPQPLAIGGGMGAEPVAVSWQIAEDEGMGRVVRSGRVAATAEWGHSVHVEVDGLQPERWYWYQFKAGNEISPKGRTRTLPALAAQPDRLRFAFASCQKYELGYYTAYEHMLREDLDLVVHLGDYIYEKHDGAGAVRPHGMKEIFSLDDYRTRYALYKTDPALQAMHAAVPWIVTWDDHEVSNDYAGERAGENSTALTPAQFLRRRAAGYQAYYEHMPLRRSALPSGPDMLLYRRLEFGRLASFNVLDTRQYRTHSYPNGIVKEGPTPAAFDPGRSILGTRQREWLFDGLGASPATWNVMAQQVMVARPDIDRGPEVVYLMDKWPGFEFERRRLLRHLHERKIRNPVVITGDIHSNWANELTVDQDNPESATVATEFVGTSISSGGDGLQTPKDTDQLHAQNPFVKFFNSERGYVQCEITSREWRTNFRTVEYVTRRGASRQTRATFVVESGRPGLSRA